MLDEAQMVGAGLGNVAGMAGRLHSHHRWAVTGTPIGPAGLDDIQGLLRVLHHDPFADPLQWKWCIAHPYLTGLPYPWLPASPYAAWTLTQHLCVCCTDAADSCHVCM